MDLRRLRRVPPVPPAPPAFPPVPVVPPAAPAVPDAPADASGWTLFMLLLQPPPQVASGAVPSTASANIHRPIRFKLGIRLQL